MEKIISDADFEIINDVESGSFCNVYHGVNKAGHHFALKKLFWTNSPDRITREVKYLYSFNHPNIVKLLYMYRNDDEATLVMDYLPHLPFRQLLPQFNNEMVKVYMKGLLSALEYIHEHNVIHRDVKPANYLFDPKTGKGVLIDFGLCEEFHAPAQFHPSIDEDDDQLLHPEAYDDLPKMMASRAGTRGFRAPEVLVACSYQTPLIDIWSAGVTLLSILSQRYPFFAPPDDLTSIYEISIILGTDRIEAAAKVCGRKVRLPEHHDGYNLKELITKLNLFIDEAHYDDQVYDLLEKLLEPDYTKRISAKEALQHPFFQ